MYEERAERGSWVFRCERPLTGSGTRLPLPQDHRVVALGGELADEAAPIPLEEPVTKQVGATV